jgi:hypothetical protein
MVLLSHHHQGLLVFFEQLGDGVGVYTFCLLRRVVLALDRDYLHVVKISNFYVAQGTEGGVCHAV